MSKLALVNRVPRQYDAASIQEIVRLIEQQENQHAEGRINARHGAMTAAPTLGTGVKGDIVWNSNPSETSNAVTGESYIILGWECTSSGSPGTWKELRVLTGAGTGYQAASPITNSLGADVALNNTASYFDGPSVAQGTVGTWFVSGTVTLSNPAVAGASRFVKLWDGTTVITSCNISNGTSDNVCASLSGYISAPAGNLRLSVRDVTSTSGKIIFNVTGNSKDSSITAFRIG